jgi:uncharacterized damage-inducible protein DinB
MFRSVADFQETWQAESKSTLRVFNALKDESLSQSVVPGGYTLGSLAGHIAGSIAAIPAHAGLLPMPEKSPAPETVAAIIANYEHNVKQLADAVVEKWSDTQIGEEIPAFGRLFRRGALLAMVIAHQTHHRAQMMVLMHQAGLTVPGVYGPSEADKAAKK